MTRKLFLSLALVVFLGTFLPLAQAQNNVGPPTGPILNLAGDPIPSVYTLYTASFMATGATTDLTFAFRNDPGYFAMDNVTVTDTTTSTAVSLVNAGFEDGNLTGWNYDNVYGATFGGVVSNGCEGMGNFAGSDVWCDGATQAYDAIDQTFGTTVGNLYTVTFELDSIDLTGSYPPSGDMQSLSTNGCVDNSGVSCSSGTLGDGVDVLVYAGASIPPPASTVPEPGTLVTLGTGLLSLAGFTRGRFARKA
jgi:hypothetical protein